MKENAQVKPIKTAQHSEIPVITSFANFTFKNIFFFIIFSKQFESYIIIVKSLEDILLFINNILLYSRYDADFFSSFLLIVFDNSQNIYLQSLMSTCK